MLVDCRYMAQIVLYHFVCERSSSCTARRRDIVCFMGDAFRGPTDYHNARGLWVLGTSKFDEFLNPAQPEFYLSVVREGIHPYPVWRLLGHISRNYSDDWFIQLPFRIGYLSYFIINIMWWILFDEFRHCMRSLTMFNYQVLISILVTLTDYLVKCV